MSVASPSLFTEAALEPGAYKLELEVLTADGRPLRRVPIDPDWEPAFETTTFDAIRRGHLPPVLTANRGRIQPIWHGTLGAPYVSAFRAIIMTPRGQSTAEIPTAYLRGHSRQVSADLVRAGELVQGDLFKYLVCAYPVEPEPIPSGGFAVEDVAEPLALVATPLGELTDSAQLRGLRRGDEMPVFIDQTVLDDALVLSRAAGSVEVGGVLLGTLHRDPVLPEIFIEVTALIPAPHTVAEAAKVTFTAETWAAVDAAIALRDCGENKIGWFHFHPNWCRNCPDEKRAHCALGEPFFSTDDVHLHRVCFSRAYHVALLVTDTPRRGLVPTLYGWQQGMVTERGFYTLPGSWKAERA
jgi:proteasome lid subunit RPN8/RPN11